VWDLYQKHVVKSEDKEGRVFQEEFDFVPADVLGSANYEPEPNWYKLEQMPYMEFYQGLRERNWTSPSYNPNAEPWKVQFFKDSGRFMRPSFMGFR
jgi:hypothetical protein